MERSLGLDALFRIKAREQGQYLIFDQNTECFLRLIRPHETGPLETGVFRVIDPVPFFGPPDGGVSGLFHGGWLALSEENLGLRLRCPHRYGLGKERLTLRENPSEVGEAPATELSERTTPIQSSATPIFI